MKEQIILEKEVAAGDFKSGGEVSSKLKDLLRKLGICTDASRRITIVTYELEMNIIIHSLGGKISVLVTSEAIRVVAEDKGPGIEDIKRAFQPGYSTASDEIREMGFGAGMGLNNIEHYSDKLEVATEPEVGTEITAVINFK